MKMERERGRDREGNVCSVPVKLEGRADVSLDSTVALYHHHHRRTHDTQTAAETSKLVIDWVILRPWDLSCRDCSTHLSRQRAKGKIDLFPLLVTSLRLFGGKKLKERKRERERASGLWEKSNLE